MVLLGSFERQFVLQFVLWISDRFACRGGHWDFRFCGFGNFLDRFLFQNTSGFRLWCSLRFADFSFFSIRFSVFVENDSGFSVLTEFFGGFAVSNIPQCPPRCRTPFHRERI